jgi:hypothetical protein
VKLTPEYLESLVQDETYSRPGGGTLTICVLTLTGGSQIVGESNVISPQNFDADLGRKYAREKAISRLWELEGYHVKRTSNDLLIRATRAAHATVQPGFDGLDEGMKHTWIACTQLALQMQPDDDIPEQITAMIPTTDGAARFCVVARAVFGL